MQRAYGSSSWPREINHWNLAKLVGISFLKISACLPTIFNFKSSIPLASIRRRPLPYITVKSGTTSPSPISHMGPILQCYSSVSARSSPSDTLHTLPMTAPFPILALTSMTQPSPILFASTTAPTSTITPLSIATPSLSFSVGSL